MPLPLSLKQRLTALSIAPSSPSSPTRADMIPGSPTRRRKFNLHWGKRSANDPAIDGEQQTLDRVQDVIGRMIFQAGVDFETRPMVVFNASALPDPRLVSYDVLLSRILSYLDLYVESDYSVVFFAAGSRHTPAWSWVWKAYRSLSRKYRKNLKQMYIVHSTFFSKMLFSLAGAVISPKFFRKLTYVNTLSDLAYYVPLTQIDISPAVYQENLKYENQITLPTPSRSNVFGVPLEDVMGYNCEKGGIPRVVKDCIQYLRETGLEEEGLFRRSPNTVMLKQAKDAYDRGHVVSLETFGDAHLAAVLLKKYIRDLPTPIFPERLYPVIRQCPLPTTDTDDMTSVIYIRETILPELAPCAYVLLGHILHLMYEMTLHSDANLMDAHNLAVVICPNLIASSNPARDVMMCAVPTSAPPPSSSSSSETGTSLGMVIKLCIQRYYEVFDELVDRAEAVPGSTAMEMEVEMEAHAVEEDEDIDDAMLVMPLGIGESGRGRARSLVGESGSAGTMGTAMAGKAKSLISIERGGTTGSRGTITLGRGATSKASGAAVEAISVTAAGFFTPPPPLPKRKTLNVDTDERD